MEISSLWTLMENLRTEDIFWIDKNIILVSCHAVVSDIGSLYLSIVVCIW